MEFSLLSPQSPFSGDLPTLRWSSSCVFSVKSSWFPVFYQLSSDASVAIFHRFCLISGCFLVLLPSLRSNRCWCTGLSWFDQVHPNLKWRFFGLFPLHLWVRGGSLAMFYLLRFILHLPLVFDFTSGWIYSGFLLELRSFFSLLLQSIFLFEADLVLAGMSSICPWPCLVAMEPAAKPSTSGKSFAQVLSSSSEPQLIQLPPKIVTGTSVRVKVSQVEYESAQRWSAITNSTLIQLSI